MYKIVSIFVLALGLCMNSFALEDSKLSTVANGYLSNLFGIYTGANSEHEITDLLSEDFYPLRRSFIDEFKFSRAKLSSCSFDYHINDIIDGHLDFKVDINWQKKARKPNKSLVQTTKGHCVLIFNKSSKLIKLIGDNPFN